MPREKGLFVFGSNFEPQYGAPLDARLVVDAYVDLINPATWVSVDGLTYTYLGMLVSVVADPNPLNNGVYRLSAPDFTRVQHWEKITNAGGGLIWKEESFVITTQDIQSGRLILQQPVSFCLVYLNGIREGPQFFNAVGSDIIFVDPSDLLPGDSLRVDYY